MDDEGRGPRRLVFTLGDIEAIGKILTGFLENAKARSVLLVDKEGHLLTREGSSATYDVDALSALIAGSFAGVKEMGRLLGEKEFSIHFIQGADQSVLLSLVGERTILAVVFTDQTTMGIVRLHASQVASKLRELFEQIADRGREGPDSVDPSGPTPLPA
jgi:predicted regulator of Ras-like GTPase activity (Roadblock/LC7/MglB family)